MMTYRGGSCLPKPLDRSGVGLIGYAGFWFRGTSRSATRLDAAQASAGEGLATLPLATFSQ
jgi:hypothetical protein